MKENTHKHFKTQALQVPLEGQRADMVLDPETTIPYWGGPATMALEKKFPLLFRVRICWLCKAATTGKLQKNQMEASCYVVNISRVDINFKVFIQYGSRFLSFQSDSLHKNIKK